MSDLELSRHLDEAEYKAIDALSRYKFMLFGYWAAIWVHLNQIAGEKRPNPFAPFVQEAKSQEKERRSKFYDAQTERLGLSR